MNFLCCGVGLVDICGWIFEIVTYVLWILRVTSVDMLTFADVHNICIVWDSCIDSVMDYVHLCYVQVQFYM